MHGEPVVAVEQLAEVLGRRLGDAVDVLRDRRDLLGDPGGGRARRRDQRVAEHAGGAGEDEGLHAGRHRLLEQVQRAGDVGVDEFLPAVGRDMRLVQGRGVQHRAHARHVAPHECAVDDRADMRGERRGEDIDADRVALLGRRSVRISASPRCPALPVTSIAMAFRPWDRRRFALAAADRAVDEGRPMRRGLGAGPADRSDRRAHRGAEQRGRAGGEEACEAAARPLVGRPVGLVIVLGRERFRTEAPGDLAEEQLLALVRRHHGRLAGIVGIDEAGEDAGLRDALRIARIRGLAHDRDVIVGRAGKAVVAPERPRDRSSPP